MSWKSTGRSGTPHRGQERPRASPQASRKAAPFSSFAGGEQSVATSASSSAVNRPLRQLADLAGIEPGRPAGAAPVDLDLPRRHGAHRRDLAVRAIHGAPFPSGTRRFISKFHFQIS